MSPVEALRPEALYRPCTEDELEFETTDSIVEPSGFFGQTRAVEAIVFGAQIEGPGHNLFVLHSFVKRFLRELNGRQGVIIPASNRSDLMLRSEVIEPGALDEVVRLASEWFRRYLGGSRKGR